MTAWQHPTGTCARCASDILLKPEITQDLRLIYVEFCPRCDAGEPAPVPWRHRSVARGNTEVFWERSAEAQPARHLAAVASRPREAAKEPEDLDLWWEGGAKHARTMETRWAAFGPRGDEDDDGSPIAADGTFSFDAPAKRKRRFGRGSKDRQSA